MTQATVSTNLLQTFQILTDLVIQDVGHHLVSFTILHIPLPVKKQSGILYCLGFCIIVMIFSTSSSESSPALLERGMSAFFKTMLAYLRPIPLIEVRANMTLVFPSMLVLRTRRICWKLGGTTKDMLASTFYLL